MGRTKIVCTIGPASSHPAALREMILAGMDVARINFSHGTLQEHAETIRHLRDVSAHLARPVAIMGDLAGPKLRIGALSKEPVILKAGDAFTLTTVPMPGDWQRVFVDFPELPRAVQAGDSILLSDGTISLAVESVEARSVRTRIRVGGILRSHKGVNIPGRTVSREALSEKDREDTAFAVAQGLDWLALSFVRTPEDVRRVRRWISDFGGEIPLIAKIEMREVLGCVEEVLRESDGAMVARGDLGVEVGYEEVPFLQADIISRALAVPIPVITATQMLESMMDRPRPTRAEATDIATAVLNGTDAVMLSEETALGRFPVEAVRTMVRIAEQAERYLDHARFMALRGPEQGVSAAVGRAACALAEAVSAQAILVPALDGKAPLWVSRHRPPRPVIALCREEGLARRLALAGSVAPLLADVSVHPDRLAGACVESAKAGGRLKSGDRAVLVGRAPWGSSADSDFIQVVAVP